MGSINAIYRHGVFEPLDEVNLQEEQHVRLNIEEADKPSALAWLAEVQKFHHKLSARGVILPDSTIDIAEDRMR
jgi:predicted DNA-binding antitoxin AbrB/MazE fold protein